MGNETCPQIAYKLAAEVIYGYIDFTPRLRGAELINTSTAGMSVASTPSGLTTSLVQATTLALTINGSTVVAAAALQFKITGGSAGTDYLLTASVVTDSTFAQTLVEVVKLKVT